MITKEEIEELREARQHVSPGEWKPSDGQGWYLERHSALVCFGDESCSENDVLFVSLAHRHVPALIARVEELETTLAAFNILRDESNAAAWDEGVLATEEGMQMGLAEFGPNPYRGDGE